MGSEMCIRDSSYSFRFLKQPTPRKGTETNSSNCFLFSLCETTHTPQGDGNSGYWQASHRLSQKQPTPARGRKRRRSRSVLLPTGNNPHPARGRKLPFAVYFAGHPAGNNPHPARGRKPLHHRQYFKIIGNNPHPAGGRKLRSPDHPAPAARNNPHPARGRKRFSVLSIAFTPETTHTPQGDGKPFVFTLQKLLEKPFTSPTGDN